MAFNWTLVISYILHAATPSALRLVDISLPSKSKVNVEDLCYNSTANHGILAIQINIAQPPHTHQGIDRKQSEQQRITRMDIGRHSRRTLRESFRKIYLAEELLEHHDPTVGPWVLLL